jgi:SPOR domain
MNRDHADIALRNGRIWMADNSLRYRTNPVFPRSRPSSDDNAFDPGHDLINANSDDPLAELARLVGEVDPYDDRRATARPSRDPWEAEDRSDPESATHHLHAPPLADYSHGDEGDTQQAYGEAQDGNWQGTDRADYDERQAAGAYYAEDGRVADQQQYAHDQYADDQYGEERYADEQSAHEQYADEQYADDDYAQRQGSARPPARRGKLVTVGLVLGLAVVGTAGAYAFRTVFSGGAPGTPPVIKADTTPTKIAAAPSDASGNKQIFDRIGDRGQNERVVPREEQPVDIKQPSPQGQAAVGGWPVPQTAPPSSATAAGQRPPSVTDPRPVKTVTISPAASQAVPQAPSPAPSAPPVVTRAPGPRAAVPQVDATAPMALAPETPARSAAPAPAHAASHYVVQLSASNTREEAEASLRTAQAKYAELIGGRQPQVRERKSPDKPSMYAAQIGGFTSREDAAQVCQQLKSAGAKCFVP